jgi:tRNA(Ile)-lysidine synthase
MVLAVSGGCDSMVLLHAVHRCLAAQRMPRPPQAAVRREDVRVVTFDHGTGPAATAAAALVVSEATRLGFQVHAGRATIPLATEAEWRAARWSYIRSVAPAGGVIATAHTADDQLETVVMRAMRGAGARGLAGLVAHDPHLVRPFLGLSRETVRRCAARWAVPFVDDPSNRSRAHFRNRVRLDLLPAIRRVRPGFGAEMHAVAARAAVLRAEVDAIAERFVRADADLARGALRVARAELATYDSEALCLLWPAIAARAHVTLDRRGTLRLAQFTSSGAPGARIQLSGGIEVFRHRDAFVLRRAAPARVTDGEVPLVGVVEFARWRFCPVTNQPLADIAGSSRETPGVAIRVGQDDAWLAELPADRRLSVREWRSGDRMRGGEGRTARRVKRYFGDARIPGPSRAGWPVVLADDEIVWIPGVRRGGAAPERSGRPVVRYLCEWFDGGPAHG